jgi:ADP-ribose pyrophosphatase
MVVAAMEESNKDIVWQGKSWNLRLTTRTLPDGIVTEFPYIDHPGAVVILPWHDTGQQVLMLRQYRHAVRDTILELPAGTRQPGEAWRLCAQRELREETGYRAQVFVDLGQFWPTPGLSNEVLSIYLAKGLRYDPLPQDNDEEIEVVSYPFEELITMALDGRLQDAKSVVGIVRAAYLMKNPPFNL